MVTPLDEERMITMSLYTQKLKLSLVTCLMTTSLIGTGLAGAAGPQQPSEAGSQVFPAQQEQQIQQDSQHKKVKKDKEKYSQDQKSKKHEESKPKNETQKPQEQQNKKQDAKLKKEKTHQTKETHNKKDVKNFPASPTGDSPDNQ